MKLLRLAMLVPLALGCSVTPPGDREELRREIATMPRERMTQLERSFMHDRAKAWLRDKDENDQVSKVQCRDDEGGKWSGWYDRPDKVLTVRGVIQCLVKKPNFPTYLSCVDGFAEHAVPDAQRELERLLPDPTGVECRHVWDFRYEPAKVDPKMVAPDAITPDDYIDAMSAGPAPPPG